jgi:hypothetical protein
MTQTRFHLEHLNFTLTDLDRATRALQAIAPAWRERGRGHWLDGAGRRIEWRHVGDDLQYFALFATPPGEVLHGEGAPFNHVGMVVDDLDAALARLAALGVAREYPGGSGAHRRSAYVCIEPERLEIELVEYDSAVPAERNEYAAA